MRKSMVRCSSIHRAGDWNNCEFSRNFGTKRVQEISILLLLPSIFRGVYIFDRGKSIERTSRG